MALIKVNKPLELRFWIVVFSVVFIGVSNSVYSQAPTLTTPADRSVIFPTDDDPFHNVSFSWSSTGASSYKIEIVSEVGFNWGQPTVDRTFTGITDTSYNADLFIGNFYKWRITDESTGHADEDGSEKYNLGLSMRRAQAVADFLINAGISPNRIDIQALRKSAPVIKESDEDAKARNRRVVILEQMK